MSLVLQLVRDFRDPGDRYTLGRLLVNDHKLDTMERAWLPNPDGGKSGRRFESCVSGGSYRLVRHNSEKYPLSWALVNPTLDVYHWPDDVPRGREPQARQTILIHPANYWHDLLGCIGPGRERVRQQSGEWMVARSRDAMNLIKTVIGSQLDVTLEIRWAATVQPKEESN